MDQTSQIGPIPAETRNMSIEDEAAVTNADIPLDRAVSAVMTEVTIMAACRKTKTEIVAYLTSHGVSDIEAGRTSTKVLTDMTAARARFDESKKKSMNSAMIRIGLGGLLMIVGFVMMASGAETSVRHVALGGFLGGAVVVASGLKELSDVQSQSFEKRIRGVYR